MDVGTIAMATETVRTEDAIVIRDSMEKTAPRVSLLEL